MKKLVIILTIFMSLFSYSAILMPSQAIAAVDPNCDKSGSFLGMPTWYKYLDVGRKNIVDPNNHNNGTDDCAIIGPTENGAFSWDKALPRIGLAIIDILLRVAGIVAIGYIVYGGFRYVTAQGDPESYKKAQGTIINALVGLIIAILSVAIVGFLGNKLWT